MKRYFITGTDTDCGKTYATIELLKKTAKSAAIKPIASGCDLVNGSLINSDALQIHNQSSLSLNIINPWRFKEPISPHLAAKNAGKRLCAQEIAEYCMSLQLDDVDTLFIEGAGGLLVPLNDEETWIDVLALMQIPVILVVGMTLGCINHALLTQSALMVNHIQCEGWIANCLDSDMVALDENIATLKQRLNMPFIAQIGYLGGIESSCITLR